MTFQNFNDNAQGMRLSEEDAATIAALRHNAKVMKSLGRLEDVWKCNANAARIISNSTVQALTSSAFESDENLVYIDGPRDYAHVSKDNKGLHLELMLIADSLLAREVIKLLQKDLEGRDVL
jgi:hypothetical protein